MPTRRAKQPPGYRHGLHTVAAEQLQHEPPPINTCGCCGGAVWWTVAERTDWTCRNCHPPLHLAMLGTLPERGYRVHFATRRHPAAYPPMAWLQVPRVPYKPRQRGATEESGAC